MRPHRRLVGRLLLALFLLIFLFLPFCTLCTGPAMLGSTDTINVVLNGVSAGMAITSSPKEPYHGIS
jgi:hypothetical protein